MDFKKPLGSPPGIKRRGPLKSLPGRKGLNTTGEDMFIGLGVVVAIAILVTGGYFGGYQTGFKDGKFFYPPETKQCTHHN